MKRLCPRCSKIMTNRNIVYCLVLIVVLMSFIIWAKISDGEKFRNAYFDYKSNSYETDPYVKSISDICSLKESEIERLSCATTIVDQFYEYNSTRSSSEDTIRNPKDLLTKKGCCRDWSVFYSSILSNLNIAHSFVYEPEHVYLQARADNETYFIDGNVFWKEE